MKNKNRTHKCEVLKQKSDNFKYLNLLKRYNALPKDIIYILLIISFLILIQGKSVILKII